MICIEWVMIATTPADEHIEFLIPFQYEWIRKLKIQIMIGNLLLQVMFVITLEVNPTLEYNNHLIISSCWDGNFDLICKKVVIGCVQKGRGIAGMGPPLRG